MNKVQISKIVNCAFIFAVITSCPGTASCAKINVLAQQDAVSEVDVDLAKLEGPRQAGDLDSLEKLIDSDLKKWSVRDHHLFLAYIYGACSEISSYAYNDRFKQAKLLTHYSFEALGSGNLSLEDQVRFVEFLSYDAADSEGLTWQKVRFRKATLWLDTWKRLSERRDSNFDPTDVPFINIAPPPGSGLPSGVSPEDVKDPTQRAEYERRLASNRGKAIYFKEQQFIKMKADQFFKEAENYLVSAYSNPPSNSAELERLLAEKQIDPAVSARLLAKLAEHH